jgi:hypothetical protein
MTARAGLKIALAVGLNLGLLLLGPRTGQGATGPTVSVTSVSGYAGHAFIYAQVTNSTLAYPAPSGLGHLSPFYSEWVPQPVSSAPCPWIWAVYVFERATGRQINMPSQTTPRPNFGTSTTVCAGPTQSPVGEPPLAEAAARLDLDLRVAVSPTTSTVGTASVVSGILSSALTKDLNRYMNMAIEEWSVNRWAVDFGDGRTATLEGRVGGSFRLSHTYRSPGRYDARAIAFISGNAQAAIYDHYGTVQLIRQPFSVEIGNHALTTALDSPVRSYLPPQVAIGVTPSLGTTPLTGSGSGFRHIDGLRGALTSLWVHMNLVREGVVMIRGAATGSGHSRLVGWRLNASADGVVAGGTLPGTVYRPDDLMHLQWNAPDRIVGNKAQDYVLPVTLFVETRYPDGHVGSWMVASSFSVTVNYAAQSG